MRDDESLDDPIPDDGEDSLLEEEFPLGDGVIDADAVVRCPHCGEQVEIALDQGGGASQEYVEDCAVCCRPWVVHVHYDGAGHADVYLDPLAD